MAFKRQQEFYFFSFRNALLKMSLAHYRWMFLKFTNLSFLHLVFLPFLFLFTYFLTLSQCTNASVQGWGYDFSNSNGIKIASQDAVDYRGVVQIAVSLK